MKKSFAIILCLISLFIDYFIVLKKEERNIINKKVYKLIKGGV